HGPLLDGRGHPFRPPAQSQRAPRAGPRHRPLLRRARPPLGCTARRTFRDLGGLSSRWFTSTVNLSMAAGSIAIAAGILEKMGAGRAGLVVGAGFGETAGVGGWRTLLGRLAECDESAGKLVAAGRLVEAAALLFRGLGVDTCAEMAESLWR